jgi:hypothetical protein
MLTFLFKFGKGKKNKWGTACDNLLMGSQQSFKLDELKADDPAWVASRRMLTIDA